MKHLAPLPNLRDGVRSKVNLFSLPDSVAWAAIAIRGDETLFASLPDQVSRCAARVLTHLPPAINAALSLASARDRWSTAAPRALAQRLATPPDPLLAAADLERAVGRLGASPAAITIARPSTR